MVMILAPLAALSELTTVVATLTALTPLTTLTTESAEAEKVALVVVPVVTEVTAVVPTAVIIVAHRDGLAVRGGLHHTGGGDKSGRGECRGGDGTPYELTHAFLLLAGNRTSDAYRAVPPSSAGTAAVHSNGSRNCSGCGTAPGVR
ncbi:hypothetical protein [Streptomyces sp. CT34]|uniref:hypothetical protein n=1 Tax=Streptomyces sp. CT34 TaxID=1553907 RepID=UPI0018E32361|nr:hypothetical protein [Streptomyces sp. CT34]